MLSMPEKVAATNALDIASGSIGLHYLDLAEWQEFVDSQPDSTAFHHRKWIEMIQQQYQMKIYIPCLRDAGQIQVAIPFLSTRTLYGARKLISLPFSDCLPILSVSPVA